MQAISVASALPLFVGALLSDLAYSSTYQIQWSNFAAWLLAGAMVFVGIALVWSLVELVRPLKRSGRPLLFLFLLIALFILGLVDCFIHARDAWAVMPQGLVVTIIVALLATTATWLAFASQRAGANR